MSPRADVPYFPAFIDLDGRLAVVIGGGGAAERRARQLARYGADVLVICADAGDTLREMEADGLLTLEERDYVRGDLAEAFLAVCVSDSEETRRAVRDEAEAERCLLTVAGESELGTFLVPSGIRRGPLQISISTSGLAPSAAKHIRRRLREEFGEEWGRLVELLSDVRTLLEARIDGPAAAREAVLDAIAESDVPARLREGVKVTAEALFGEFSPRAVGAMAEIAEREKEAERERETAGETAGETAVDAGETGDAG